MLKATGLVTACAVFAAALLGGARVATATTMTLTTSASAPTANIVESCPTEDRDTSQGPLSWTSAMHRIWGQSFRHDAANFPLDTIVLLLNNTAQGTENVQGKAFRMEVFELDSTSDATPNVPSVLSATGTMPGSMPTGFQYVTFDFASAPTLTAGQQYGFSVDFTSEDPNNVTVFREELSDAAYGNGKELLSQDGGGSWSTIGDNLTFFVIEVPEPGTVALLSLGGLALLSARRKRKAKA